MPQVTNNFYSLLRKKIAMKIPQKIPHPLMKYP